MSRRSRPSGLQVSYLRTVELLAEVLGWDALEPDERHAAAEVLARSILSARQLEKVTR